MKKFSLKEYAESSTSAPETIGYISTAYGRKQIYTIAEYNGLSEALVTGEYATVVPFGVDHKTAVALEYIYDTLEEYGAECYTTEYGEVYAVKVGLDYSYLDNDTEDEFTKMLNDFSKDDSE